MARQLRIEFEGAFYHVTSRGNMRERIFFEDRDRERFLEILKRTKHRYGYLLHAYVLMDNHYHFMIETPKANLSQTMQNINTSYTVYANKKHRRSGHLFQGRFKAIIVDKDEYLVSLSRYIHLNPVRAGIVEKPEDYRWSSYGPYMDNSSGKDELTDIGETLSRFSERKQQAIKAYRDFVESGIGKEDKPFEDVEAGILLGRSTFKERIKALLDIRKEDGEIPQVRRLRKTITIDRVVEGCCGYYGKGREELLQRRIGERGMAVYLSKVLSGRKNIEIGDYFGIKGPAVSNVIKGFECRIENENKLKKEVELVKDRIINEE
ncbi:MAG: REP-associated tyrosine transposase [Thermodesulfovibrionales bacterium]